MDDPAMFAGIGGAIYSGQRGRTYAGCMQGAASLATLVAILRASSSVSNLTADRRPSGLRLDIP